MIRELKREIKEIIGHSVNDAKSIDKGSEVYIKQIRLRPRISGYDILDISIEVCLSEKKKDKIKDAKSYEDHLTYVRINGEKVLLRDIKWCIIGGNIRINAEYTLYLPPMKASDTLSYFDSLRYRGFVV